MEIALNDQKWTVSHIIEDKAVYFFGYVSQKEIYKKKKSSSCFHLLTKEGSCNIEKTVKVLLQDWENFFDKSIFNFACFFGPPSTFAKM